MITVTVCWLQFCLPDLASPVSLECCTMLRAADF